MKDRILKLAENVTDQQKNDINSTPFTSLCLDESIDITKSTRLAVFARYCVGNIIKEELIAITSLLTTTKGTDICTAVRNSLVEKEYDLKKIVSVTTDGAPNMFSEYRRRAIVLCVSNDDQRCPAVQRNSNPDHNSSLRACVHAIVKAGSARFPMRLQSAYEQGVATDFTLLNVTLTNSFPMVRNRSELEAEFYKSKQDIGQSPSDRTENFVLRSDYLNFRIN
ncbi:general transcription factor II-I repeat domain-containing protein 2A [Trichonephila clavipes]|nr:general transcription factor II-I repeat domain-containing protein 2A [Trichonephila clavipes]